MLGSCVSARTPRAFICMSVPLIVVSVVVEPQAHLEACIDTATAPGIDHLLSVRCVWLTGTAGTLDTVLEPSVFLHLLPFV